MLLVYKAQRLRLETGNWALHAQHEKWDISVQQLARKYLVRPFQLLFTPVCFLVALYASFVYGILYASPASFPIEFEDERGWNQVVGALPFLALFVGMMLAAVASILNQKYYFKRFGQNDNQAVPEACLPPMMFGSVIFAAGLCIFAWTSDRSIHWIGPVLGAACVGVGYFTILQAALNYLIDTFAKSAASAIAANTCLRSMFAGVFPLFLPAMVRKLGIDWGVSVFGFVAVLLMLIPFLFFVFGDRIRARGIWSRESI
ncbi:hypothetical protein H2201_006482 [Coniosporium apollinis]|uniref:Major facilitator superfamily (MFS) profile domain-containing protein n=2 Tax=Coniosporium TaxID=2810619 RepID=A0ABQ9NNZ8_9PEZI|nr:hypothetical protein H2199_007856 [Cladosporium sp. JES 115]KAJ9661451.1 hypothetical protein H2201_006482 [Coniosporium apollinis]